MAESNDVGAMLIESGGKCQPFRVVRQRDKASLAVAVVAHEDCQLAIGLQGQGRVAVNCP